MHILIATGGSGGHIFPAIETAKVLRLRGHRVSFAGVLGSAKNQIQALDFPVFLVAAEGFKDASFLDRYKELLGNNAKDKVASVLSKRILANISIDR